LARCEKRGGKLRFPESPLPLYIKGMMRDTGGMPK